MSPDAAKEWVECLREGTGLLDENPDGRDFVYLPQTDHSEICLNDFFTAAQLRALADFMEGKE